MIMEKAILYKEWIKTRGYCLLALIVSCGMVVYSLIKMRYIIEIKGVEHLWMVMMERDAVFVDRLTYLPVIVGTLLAIVQFVPEMQQKRMKLMLHLPYPRFLNISIMLLYGLCCLLTCFALHFAGIWLYTRTFLPPELYSRMLLTALPWYIAGFMVYLLSTWCVLEPTWKRRIVNVAITVAIISTCFLSTNPEVYNRMTWLLATYTILCFFLPMLSVQRFIDGKQD